MLLFAHKKIKDQKLLCYKTVFFKAKTIYFHHKMEEEGIQKLTRDQCTEQLKDTLKTQTQYGLNVTVHIQIPPESYAKQFYMVCFL